MKRIREQLWNGQAQRIVAVAELFVFPIDLDSCARPIQGMIEGCGIVCPWHAWVFDVTTGQSPVNPRAKIPCYPVKVEGSDLFVGI